MTLTYEALIQPFLWIVLGVAVAVFLFHARKRHRAERSARRPLLWAAGCAAVAVLVVPSVAWVPAGHRGVIYEWSGGVNPGERGEGMTFLAPWVQTVQLVSVRTQKVENLKVFAQSSDLQEITAPISVGYHVDPNRAAELYQEVGLGYRETVVLPQIDQQAKAAIGLVRAEDFAKSRDPLAEAIREHLTTILDPYGIVVEWVSVLDAVFDKEFIAAVKAKIIAEQVALKERNLVQARLAVKQQTIINAEARRQSILLVAQGQAKGNEILRRSLTPEVIRWRWLGRWNGILPSTLVGSDGVTLLLGGSGISGY